MLAIPYGLVGAFGLLSRLMRWRACVQFFGVDRTRIPSEPRSARQLIATCVPHERQFSQALHGPLIIHTKDTYTGASAERRNAFRICEPLTISAHRNWIRLPAMNNAPSPGRDRSRWFPLSLSPSHPHILFFPLVAQAHHSPLDGTGPFFSSQARCLHT